MVTTTKFINSIPLNLPYQYLFCSKRMDNNPIDQSPIRVYRHSEKNKKQKTKQLVV